MAVRIQVRLRSAMLVYPLLLLLLPMLLAAMQMAQQQQPVQVVQVRISTSGIMAETHLTLQDLPPANIRCRLQMIIIVQLRIQLQSVMSVDLLLQLPV